MPYTWLSGSAELRRRAASSASSTASPIPRSALSVNLYGAPALTLPEFADYQQDLIVGASLRVSAPWGQYDDSRVVNIGTNRWAFKPEVGVSKAVGPWTLEVTAAATSCSPTTTISTAAARARRTPLYSLQGHAIYSFRSGIWGSLDATYFTGGRTTIDGSRNRDLQQNWRVGATLAFPVDRNNSVKPTRAAACRRARATTSTCSGSRGSTAGAADSESLAASIAVGARTGHRACARARTGSA